MQKSIVHRSNPALYLALAGDILVAGAKFAVASATGSSALFSEGVHSSVDAASELLLLYGVRAAQRPSTAEHQLGFGREVFFWNFIVAMTILALGAGVALLDGLHHITRAVVVGSPLLSYGVLLIAAVAEIPALTSVIRSINAKRGKASFVHYVRYSRDVTMLTILFGGVSGVTGLLIASAGTFLSMVTNNSAWDGLASVMIAAILAATALFLAATSKRMLIGVPAAPATVRSILSIAKNHPDVRSANGALTVHLAPDQILVALSVAFRPTLETNEIETAVAAIDLAVRSAHPSVVDFLLKPQSADQFQALQIRRGW